jgi:hypothetical protein
MSVPEHLGAAVARVRAMPFADPPPPWAPVRLPHVGGTTDIGFGPRSDLLLVVSHAGRGVFDCRTGERLARDDADYLIDVQALEADGIGPLAGSRVRVSGIHGGGLCRVTADGWKVEELMLDWPEPALLVEPPGTGALWPGHETGVVKFQPDITEVRAWGFSPTGRSLVLAESGRLRVWRR